MFKSALILLIAISGLAFTVAGDNQYIPPREVEDCCFPPPCTEQFNYNSAEEPESDGWGWITIPSGNEPYYLCEDHPLPEGFCLIITRFGLKLNSPNHNGPIPVELVDVRPDGTEVKIPAAFINDLYLNPINGLEFRGHLALRRVDNGQNDLKLSFVLDGYLWN